MEKQSQKITPCLWFDDQAEDAVDFYLSTFGNGERLTTSYRGEDIPGGETGSALLVEFALSGQKFVALNGGPYFTLNPSISFFVVCETESEIDDLWEKLSDGGEVMMPLDKYPWSEKYGWVQDRYGVSWQLSFGKLQDVGQKFTPMLMYTGDQAGRAEEAINLYTSLFDDSEVVGIARYEEGEGDKVGLIKHAQFKLHGEVFMAMESTLAHAFSFNEALSLIVDCKSQEEVDHFWNKLSDGDEANLQQCGWLKDRFGVSWQIVPDVLPKLMNGSDAAGARRVTQAMLKMKKLDVAELQRAYEGA